MFPSLDLHADTPPLRIHLSSESIHQKCLIKGKNDDTNRKVVASRKNCAPSFEDRGRIVRVVDHTKADQAHPNPFHEDRNQVARRHSINSVLPRSVGYTICKCKRNCTNQ